MCRPMLINSMIYQGRRLNQGEFSSRPQAALLAWPFGATTSSGPSHFDGIRAKSGCRPITRGLIMNNIQKISALGFLRGRGFLYLASGRLIAHPRHFEMAPKNI